MSKCVVVRVLPLESFRPLEHPKTALLSKDVAEGLEIGEGDIVKISAGSKASAARVATSRSTHRAIALKYSLRLSLSVTVGEYAEVCVEKVSPAKAQRTVLRPEASTIREVSYLPTALLVPSPIPPFVPVTVFGLIPTQRDVDLKTLLPKIKLILKRSMLGAPYVKGDYVVLSGVSIFTQAETVFRVVDTHPEGVVTVANETDIEVEAPERSQLPGSDSPNSVAKP